MRNLYGAHVSAAGGVNNAIANISKYAGTALAFFLKNERQWKAKPYTPEIIEKFKQNSEALNYDPTRDMLPHGSYLINLGNPSEEARAKSEEAFLDELSRCEQLGITRYNFHPGSSLGHPKSSAIELIAAAINRAHEKTSTVIVVLENMTGNSDRIVGTQLEDLAQIIERVHNKGRIGVCIDTCHAFTAGYDLRSPEEFDKFWKSFDEIIGYKYLAGLHLNDSKHPFGSKRDVHQNLGLGFLGLEPFRLVMNKPELAEVPKILETPYDSKKDEARLHEIALLKWLIGRSKDDTDYAARAAELSAEGSKQRAEIEANAKPNGAKKSRKKQKTE